MTTELEHRRALQAGEHLCLLHESEAERLAAVVPFLRHGLDAGERCLYVAAKGGAPEIQAALRGAGVDLEFERGREALVLVTAAETYLRDGRFDPAQMIDLL